MNNSSRGFSRFNLCETCSVTIDPGRLDEARLPLRRTALSSQVAAVLRGSILHGDLRPGTRLIEADLCSALAVSRNTLREAFRSLLEEQLIDHALNRGMFVHTPRPEEVADLYRCRRVVECAAVRRSEAPGEVGLAAMRDALAIAEQAAEVEDWLAVGTADIAFHAGIAALHGSYHLDRLMAPIWNQTRLAFHVMDDPLRFHSAYLKRNLAILNRFEAGDPGIERMLHDYLCDAERELTAAIQPLDD